MDASSASGRGPLRAAKLKALRSLSSAAPAAFATPAEANAGPATTTANVSRARRRVKQSSVLSGVTRSAVGSAHDSGSDESKENVQQNSIVVPKRTTTTASCVSKPATATATSSTNSVTMIMSEGDDDFQVPAAFRTPRPTRERRDAGPSSATVPVPGPATRSMRDRSAASASASAFTAGVNSVTPSGNTRSRKRAMCPEASLPENVPKSKKTRETPAFRREYNVEAQALVAENCIGTGIDAKGKRKCTADFGNVELGLLHDDSEEERLMVNRRGKGKGKMPVSAVEVCERSKPVDVKGKGKACAKPSSNITNYEAFGSDSSMSDDACSSGDDFVPATSSVARMRTRQTRVVVAIQTKKGDEAKTLEEESDNSGDGGDAVSEASETSDSSASEAQRRPVRRRTVSKPLISRAERVTQDLQKYHPELKSVWDNLDKIDAIKHEPAPQPKDLKLKLLPFQQDGVGWMCKQEVGEYGGGILADEMGMGKTIQTISLLLLQRGRPTLVVCPTVALGQWQSEIATHAGGALSVLVYHGAKKECSAEVLKAYDVILTTYSIIESSFRQQEYGTKKKGQLMKAPSVLHSIHFFRVVLDEAHSIKDRACNTARATFALKCDRKWSLSGTPLQNRVGELYSQIRFLEIEPYSYYFCRKCDCKSLHWRFSNRKTCDDCNHHAWMHVCWWNAEILKPIQKYGAEGLGREAFAKLKKLLSRLMLRRTKVERADDLGLPPRVVTTRKDYFNEEEMDFYESLFKNVSRLFSSYVANDTVLHNYANIFELLMRMRQAVNHPDLVTKHNRFLTSKDSEAFVCAICSDEAEDPIMSRCRHVFCREDARDFIETADAGLPTCPQCFVPLQIDLSQPTLIREAVVGEGLSTSAPRSSIVNRIDMDRWRSSTKIEALVEELHKLRSGDATVKSIVFSQFIRFLQLVAWRLKRAGFECVMLDGSMTPAQRDAAIKAFSTNPHITVFLVSLKAGGVALNLTEASQIFLLDAWWNPQVMNQAADRIHRLGQHRPIRITRIVIENSIESRIIELQRKKEALFQSTIGGDQNALNRLTKEDLQFLFCL